MKKIKSVVIGKFMPLHNGHIYMINFAKNFSDELTVLADNLPSHIETMSLESRVNILKKEFKDIIIKGIDIETYQEPEDSENFWEFWRDTIIRNVGYKPDYIIGSMDYIKKLAEVIGCQFIMIDKERENIPISATIIRDAYKEYNLGNTKKLKDVYQYIPNSSREYYIKDIYIVGGESTGKTTFAKKLSSFFETLMIKEYAEYYIKENSKDLNEQDLFNIAKAQLSEQITLRKDAFYYCIHDTDVITTKIWYMKLFNKSDTDIFDDLIKKQKDGLYLLLDNNNVWIEDFHRYFKDKEDREWFFNEFKIQLNKYNKNYLIIEDRNINEKNITKIKKAL